MESGFRSRKRKQRSSESDPFGGIFTRSRSQIYFHRHRSGYARADSNRSRDLTKLMKGRDESVVKREEARATEDQSISQVSVKDLRARRVFSPAAITDDGGSIGEVDLEGEFDVHRKNDGNPKVLVSEVDAGCDLGVSCSDAGDLKASPENVVDSASTREANVMEAEEIVQVTPNVVDSASTREANLMEAEEIVQVTPTMVESDQNKRPEEKDDRISAANEIPDTKGSISKSHSSVTSLRGRRKVFKSPSSFSYRRLLPYLKDLGNTDSSSFEIIEETWPKVMKSSETIPSMVPCKDEGIAPVSNCSKLADGLSNNAQGFEKHLSNSLSPDLISTVENSDAVQKSHEDVVNDTLEKCQQMTPPDSDIYNKSKTDKTLGVPVKPSKLVLKPCSRMQVLPTPTSFSHRRLLPFLMSVSGDDSSATKGNQDLTLGKATEQSQHPSVSMDQSKTNKVEKSNSPTSTLIPIDSSPDGISPDTLVSNDNLLECSGPITQLEENLPADKAIKSDSSIKMEQTSPKNHLKRVEEATSKAIVPDICTEQNIVTNIEFSEKTQQSSLQIAPPNGILKRTPRGCRGICNCLNCTSFRLHAERSFEFSRNQMHDAEEVALELINDLTCLRNILERTAKDSNSLAVSENQVKEVCEKSFFKEQAARARLAQMNEDLSIHCRSMKLLRPSVTFANKIEEKFISKNEVYRKKSV